MASDGEGRLARLSGWGARLLASRIVRGAFLALAAALCGLAVARQWPQVRASLARLDAPESLASFVAALAALGCAMAVWRVLLADLGSPLPPTGAARVFFVSQLSKYVPGSVWPLLAQMELGRDAGVPRQRSAAAFVLALLVANVSGLLVACVTLPLLSGYGPGWFRWLALAAPALLVVAHPRAVNPLLRRSLRVARQQPLTRALSRRGAAAAYLWSLSGWAAAGVHVWLLASDLGARGPRSLLVAAGGFALAWCAGFAVVVLPAGAGARDLTLAVALAPVLGFGSALVVALVSRLLFTVGDLLTAVLGLLVTSREPQE